MNLNEKNLVIGYDIDKLDNYLVNILLNMLFIRIKLNI